MHPLTRLLALVLALVSVAEAQAQPRRPDFTLVFSKEEFARRRAKVVEAIGPNAIAVIRGNEDTPNFLKFRQGNDFFYLTGVEAPGAILLLDGASRRAMLFLPARDEPRERSEGPVLIPDDTARDLTGVTNVADVKNFAAALNQMAGPRDTLYAPTAPQELEAVSRDVATRYNLSRLNDPWDGRLSREAHFLSLIQERFPTFAVKSLSPILDQLRLIKSPEEIAVIRRSSELAALALMEAMRSTQPGQYEYELDGLARFLYFRNGAQGLAYFAIVASGRNAWFPHYNAANRKMADGDMLLMDFAPDYHYYMADVTRVWPVNGKFSAEQRELYGFYLRCYQAILKHIRPNVPVKTIMTEAADDMDAALRQARFSKDKYRRAAERFVADYRERATTGPARLGHWVGLSTHDVGGAVEVLKPGMVFTIEPALRVPEDETYIRLEDMLLVTESGVENLSALVPMEMDAIEALMKEQGLLEKYPRQIAHDVVRPSR